MKLHPFSKYVAILGRGKTKQRALTFEEARDSMAMILLSELELHPEMPDVDLELPIYARGKVRRQPIKPTQIGTTVDRSDMQLETRPQLLSIDYAPLGEAVRIEAAQRPTDEMWAIRDRIDLQLEA